MTTKRANTSPPQQQWIAVAAYYKALSRGFTPHNAQQDWLEAEQELSHYSQLAPKKIGLITLRRA